MRVDKFLQISRLVKRRNAANVLCSRGNVLLNNHPAKAGKTVNVGDHITIINDPLPTEERQELTYEILEVPSGNVSKARAITLYRLIK
ncbi:RNA-binding S4 domain-containing protein [Candidatus Poribacteria bacterium]|nr:RNA-binding S4 domain-containing protein [Candidatus Poribacteria bacterium]